VRDEQLDIFEFIESPQEKEYRLEQERIKRLDEWANNFDSYVKMVHYAGLVHIFDEEEYKKNVLEVANSYTYHFGNTKDNIYIGSFKVCYENDKPSYNRLYYKNKKYLLEVNMHHKNITDDIYFPAMCIKIFDNTGTPINFGERENFIMNDLGFAEIGTLRSDIFKVKEFCTLKVTWDELINYLKGGTYEQD